MEHCDDMAKIAPCITQTVTASLHNDLISLHVFLIYFPPLLMILSNNHTAMMAFTEEANEG
jgi:hypothetical protein